MSIESNKARYEGIALQALMEASDHTACARCYCCDSTVESYPCWQCGGFEADWADDTDSGACSVCHGEGEIFVMQCLGRCDDDGNHKEGIDAVQD